MEEIEKRKRKKNQHTVVLRVFISFKAEFVSSFAWFWLWTCYFELVPSRPLHPTYPICLKIFSESHAPRTCS